ncbi:MAG: cobalamin-dependent protein [Magnetococcus sp. YQC-5]
MGTLKYKIGLVQINNSFSGAHYLPYTVGLLQAYAQYHNSNPDRFDFLMPIFRREPVENIVEQLKEANLVAFSLYVWNFQLSLQVIRALKRTHHDILIVVGGPHVPNEAETFLRENPQVDLAVHGEGEQVFNQLLDLFPSKEWSRLAGVSWLDALGAFHTQAPTPRIREIDTIPSPYLTGVFNLLLARKDVREWLALWETNRGCPFSCSFCDWGSATSAKVARFDMTRLRAEMDWFSQNRIGFIFCCDANFGILKRDVEIARYAVENRKRYGFPEALSVQNTKNATSRAYEIQHVLSQGGLNKGVTLSMQTTNPLVLANIGRDNISLDTYKELQRRFTKDGVVTYSDLILGLPGETYDSFANGTDELIQSGQHNRIQFGNLSVLPNSEMGSLTYQQRHGLERVASKILNIHGAHASQDWDVDEFQELIVATASMPKEAWRQARVFSWTASLLHFDKLMQIPFVVLNQIFGISYRELIEAFIHVDGAEFPLLHAIQTFFCDRAEQVQRGEPEYYHSAEWLDIWWPDDEYMLIRLATRGELELFYSEAKERLRRVLTIHQIHESLFDVLDDAISLNCHAIKRPGLQEDLTVTSRFNIVEIYQGALSNQPLPLKQGSFITLIRRKQHYWQDWLTWCREVVWFGNKKGAYLYVLEDKSSIDEKSVFELQPSLSRT